MFTLLGPSHRYCDGLSRRSFLQIGSLALGGLTLPSLLRADAETGKRKTHKSVIMVYLSGGLAHQDSFDLKPNAPPEIRGEFKPISTNVPGIQIGEHLPRLAKITDKLAIVRSVVGLIDEHSSWQTLTGFPMSTAQREGRPNFGSVISKVQGSVDEVMPAFVDLFPTMQHRPYNIPGPGPLGRTFSGTKVDGDDVAIMKLKGTTSNELADRRELLYRFDEMRKRADSADLSGMDAFYQKAFDVLTSSKLVEALDVTREPVAVRDRYGRGSPKHQGDGAPLWNDQLLMARRLVEAGARCVTVAYGFWDTHGGNFRHLKGNLPVFDQGISALVEDIHARGMDRDTLVVVMGEFGRTPKINKDAGRDHWSRVNGVLFAGGGLNMGQVIGSTDSTAAEAKDMPVHYRDVLATIYHALGIDPHAVIRDVSGRPFAIMPSTVSPIGRLI